MRVLLQVLEYSTRFTCTVRGFTYVYTQWTGLGGGRLCPECRVISNIILRAERLSFLSSLKTGATSHERRRRNTVHRA